MKANMFALGAGFVVLLVSSLGHADTPITSQSTSKFCSKSTRYCATSNASRSVTVIKDSKKPSKIAWSVNEFVPYGYISDDGRVVASCYPGKNLVPDTANLTFVVVKLFSIDGKTRNIVLRDLYSAIDQLPATVSHRDWGGCIGFQGGSFEVKRADGSIWKVSQKI